jgi:Ni2+-binding GTPase involved in maturation of urease and hydrogenase
VIVAADFLMIAGFLGAGKTTAMLELARRLTAGGRRVALITNDQSRGPVDTAVVESAGFAVEEITGGCFCSRFDSLTQASARLASTAAPDVLLAEPVGSCTDLRATVQYPLMRMCGGQYRVGPISVLVDPLRARRVLGLDPGKPFSPKVLYIYDKQLEEADIIVINKCDLLGEAALDRLQSTMHKRYRYASVLRTSTRDGSGIDAWLQLLNAEPGGASAPQVDYDLYAEGEALLGWLNGTARVEAAAPVDGNRLLRDLATAIRGRLSAQSIEIAHLKMTLRPDAGRDLGTINLVDGRREAEASRLLRESLTAGELLVNLRAEGRPEALREAVESALAHAGTPVLITHLEHFRPARPTPTHRLESVREAF